MKSKKYPHVVQSFGITGIVILGMLLFSPVNLVLNKIIGQEASTLVYYLLAIGTPFIIIYLIRKKKTSEGSFDLNIENKRTIPFVIIGTVALLFGIISPIGSLIPIPESIKEAIMNIAGETGVFAFILMVITENIKIEKNF